MDQATGGIQSLDAALRLLKQLAARGGPAALSDLAREAEMPVSKAHRYLASFVAAGLVQQTARSGKYDLGPAALELGLAAMVRRDFVNLAADRLPDLVAETGQTALLCVWGSFGPTVVRWERSANFIVTSLGLGSTLPLQGSATGRVFLAFSPPQITKAVLAQEPQGPADALKDETRDRGWACVSGDLIAGLAAISAPVLNWQGEIEAAVTLIGTDVSILNSEGPALAALRRVCGEIGAG